MADGIHFQMEQGADTKLRAYLQATVQKLIAAAKVGMREAMQTLATNTVAKMSQAGIQNRTGGLANSILKSPHVSGSGDLIKGTVSSFAPDGKPVGAWLQGGTQHSPLIKARVMVFIGDDGKPVFTRKRKAYVTPPRPFMNPALAESKEMIVATIRERMMEALSK